MIRREIFEVWYGMWIDVIGLAFSTPPDVNTFIHPCAAVRSGGYPVSHTLCWRMCESELVS